MRRLDVRVSRDDAAILACLNVETPVQVTPCRRSWASLRTPRIRETRLAGPVSTFLCVWN